MRYFITVLFIALLCQKLMEAQTKTYTGLPGPENVLVVYKIPNPNDPADTISRAVKDYYKEARSIPDINIFPITSLPPREILNYNGEDHVIKIVQSGDIIQDSTEAEIDSAQVGYQSSFHAWQYYYNHIALPIKNYIAENNLSSTIRYIVLCKGVPYKIQAMGDWDGINNPINKNVSLQCLLSLLNNEPYYTTLQNLFNGTGYSAKNPFNMEDNDDYYYLDYRFLPDHYINEGGLKLSYLVTRLDGLSYTDVTEMIDNAKNADMSGERTWVLDAHPGAISPSFRTANFLSLLGFEVNYDNTSNFTIDNHLFNYNDVIAYSSAGTHAGMPADYIQNLLEFTYAPGAIFNTFESFNGNSVGEIKRRGGQGLLTEYIYKGGTGGICYPWEPFNICLANDEVFMPAYALGYNIIDALYMSTDNMIFQFAIVGDPLTRIYNYETKIISMDTTITTGDIYCKIVVPEGKTLYIASGAVVNFKRNAYLQVNGNIVIEPGAQLHFKGVSKLSINNASFDNSVVIDFKDYSRFLIDGNLNLGEDFVLNLFNKSKLVTSETGNIIFSSGVVLNANDTTKVFLNDITFEPEFTFNFYNSSSLNASNVTIEPNSNTNFYNNSIFQVADTLNFLENSYCANMRFSCGRLFINLGTKIHFNGNSGSVNTEIKILGTLNGSINLYDGNISFSGNEDIDIYYCNFTNGSLSVEPDLQIDMISLNNCSFNGSPAISIYSGNDISINHCSYSNTNGGIIIHKSNHLGSAILKNLDMDSFGTENSGIRIFGIITIMIDSCSISDGNNSVSFDEVSNPIITNSIIDRVNSGITVGHLPHPGDIPMLNQIDINNNSIQALQNGINFYQTNFANINIENNYLSITGNNIMLKLESYT
jgi:uncharacterized protein (TIGR03790 family)